MGLYECSSAAEYNKALDIIISGACLSFKILLMIMIVTLNYHLVSVFYVSGTGLDPLFPLFYLILMATLQGIHLLLFSFPKAYSLLDKEPGFPP